MNVDAATPFAAAVVLAAVWLFVVPALTLGHELGHAAAVLVLTEADATVIVGGERWGWEWGHLGFRFDPGGWRRWLYGFCRYGALPDGAIRAVAVHLAGPAATAGALSVLAVAVSLTDGRWVRFGLYAALWNALLTLVVTVVPMRYTDSWGEYAGHPSDGLQAWRALTDGSE